MAKIKPQAARRIQFQPDPVTNPPGHVFYVSMTDSTARRAAVLLGPYATHAEARAKVDAGRDLACERDPFAWFNRFGTCSAPAEVEIKPVFGLA
jgi:hypothetical protein